VWRFTNAILTDEGFQTLAAAAPGHVAHVRSLVTDALSPEQLRRLARDADRVMSRIDTSGPFSPQGRVRDIGDLRRLPYPSTPRGRA
jgi:hypothetical protein